MSTTRPNGNEGAKETGRVEAFSDGVFAIAVTLLVLNLNVVPEGKLINGGGLAAELRSQWPMFLAYVVSFAFILIMWINHHNMFRPIKRIDHTFLLLNGLLLLLVAFVPYTTELIATYAHAKQSNQFVAVVVYNGTYLLIAVAFNVLWRYAASGQRLLDTGLPPDLADSISRRYRFGPLMYLACIALGLVSVLASLALNVVLAIFFAWPHQVASQSATTAKPEQINASKQPYDPQSYDGYDREETLQ